MLICLSLFGPKFELESSTGSRRGVALGNESSCTSVCRTCEALFSATLANKIAAPEVFVHFFRLKN